jgi:acyl carrier protein
MVRFSYTVEGKSYMSIDIKSAADIEALLLELISRGSTEDPDYVVSPQTIPDKDIKGFDSLTALEVLTELEEETGIHMEGDIFYVDTKPKRYLPVHDIALAIWSRVQEGGKSHA